MALPYAQQPYFLYPHPQWPDNVKPALTEDDSSSILDDKVLDHPTPADMTTSDSCDSRRPSIPKLEDDFAATPNMWHDRPHGVMPLQRHYSQPSVPMSAQNPHPFAHLNQVNCPPTMYPSQTWPLFARSEASTPTPFFTPVPESFDTQPQYPGGPVNVSAFSHNEPLSAISMSPDSSQGGWASTTSSDAAEAARGLRHTRLRGSSPMLVLRSDGIRKKNAKFEIPKDRNLDNIDKLIQSTSNEEERKELKQQKRLLRNRQAALDSRQRKKNHTERLELDKKGWEQEKRELQEAIAQQEQEREQWSLEQEQWIHRTAQLEQIIQSVQYERDEAIRTRVLETAELRRMNNLLKDTVRDLERQQASRNFSSDTSDTFANDFSNFNVEDSTWDDEFALIGSEHDLKMEDSASLNRQATPRPPSSVMRDSSTSTPDKSVDVKVEAGSFSWNTFNMCLLAGAFIVSQAGMKAPANPSSVALVTPGLPTLADDYHAEARNVLNAVLGSNSDVVHEVLPTRAAPPAEEGFGASIAAQSSGPTSSLENLHSALTTPSRQQQVAAAFSLSASSYNHIANPEGAFDDDGHDDDEDAADVRPTRLQQLFARMQAETDNLDRMSGMGSKARERSVLLDRVPEKVLRDFKEMFARTE